MHVLQSAGERGALRACHVPGLITVAVAGLGGTLGSIKLIFNDATSQTTPFASEQDPDYGEIFKPVEYAFDVGETVTNISVTCAPCGSLPVLCVADPCTLSQTEACQHIAQSLHRGTGRGCYHQFCCHVLKDKITISPV